VVTHFPGAAASGSDCKVSTTGRARGDAPLSALLHTIHGRLIAASLPGFTIGHKAVAAAKPAKSQSRGAGSDGSVAIMRRSQVDDNRRRAYQCPDNISVKIAAKCHINRAFPYDSEGLS
jgi:hypothetical protein